MSGRLFFGLVVLSCPVSGKAAGADRAVVNFDGKATEVAATPAALQSVETRVDLSTAHRLKPVLPDLWVTLEDLKRARGYELTPQGVYRKELCFPLPKKPQE